MVTNDEKVGKKLQRFLRLVALRGGIQRAKVMALIIRKGKIALSGDGLPRAEVMDWDLDGALSNLSQRLGARFNKASYLGFHDLGGVRHYTFSIDAEPVSGAKYVALRELDTRLADEERKALMVAMRRRAGMNDGDGE